MSEPDAVERWVRENMKFEDFEIRCAGVLISNDAQRPEWIEQKVKLLAAILRAYDASKVSS